MRSDVGRGVLTPEAVVTSGCKLSDMSCEPNPGPWEDQQVLLTDESQLQEEHIGWR